MNAEPEGVTVEVSPEERRAAEEALRGLFLTSGFVRGTRPSARPEGAPASHKGWEARLVVRSDADVPGVLAALGLAGLKAGRVWRKHGQHVVPVYGKKAFVWFTSEYPFDRPRGGQTTQP